MSDTEQRTYILTLSEETSLEWVRGFAANSPMVIEDEICNEYIAVSGDGSFIETLHFRDQFDAVEVEGHGTELRTPSSGAEQGNFHE